MHALIDKVLNDLCRRAGTHSIADAFAASRVRGLTIAAPTTDTPLSQDAISAALAPVFELGLPIALYQLPQVTGNTMTPELVAGLAERFRTCSYSRTAAARMRWRCQAGCPQE